MRLSRIGGAVITALFVIWPIASGVAVAQERFASIEGRVTDRTGQGLAGATVSASSASLIRGQMTSTSSSGDFVLPLLTPGFYVVTFSADGFITHKQTLVLAAGEALRLNRTLGPSRGFDSAITVTALNRRSPGPGSTTWSPWQANQSSLPLDWGVRLGLILASHAYSAGPPGLQFSFDGLPLRQGWATGSTPSFIGPGPEAVEEIRIAATRLDASDRGADTGLFTMVLLAGSNRFSGAVRAYLSGATSDSNGLSIGRATHRLAGSAESTIDIPLMLDRTWLVAGVRHLRESVGRETSLTQEPFSEITREAFAFSKITHAVSSKHRLEVDLLGSGLDLRNAPPSSGHAGELAALDGLHLRDTAFSAAYAGRPFSQLDLTARITREIGRVDSPGSGVTIIDQETGTALAGPPFCSVCSDANSHHDTFRLTVGTLFSGRRSGSHYLTAGTEATRDVYGAPQTAPDGSFELHATRLASVSGGVPIFVPGGSSWIVWYPSDSGRARITTASAFVQDRWTATSHLSITAGLRFDSYRGLTELRPAWLAERTTSPRVSVAWSPSTERWMFVTGYARYAPSPFDRTLDTTLVTQPPTMAFVYEGPEINAAGGAPIPAERAADLVLEWFRASGGVSQRPWFASVPGVTTTAGETRRSPVVDEWSAGFTRLFGEQLRVRAELQWREHTGFSSRTVEKTTGAGQFDSGQVVQTSRLSRRYRGLALTAAYRLGHYGNLSSEYVYSDLRGNARAETPLAAGSLAYPEYFDTNWRLPAGRLPGIPSHQLRIWGHTELLAHDKHGLLVLSGMYRWESGRPYGAVGWVSTAPYVDNPGYIQPPAAVPYYFTSPDARSTSGLGRIDLAVSYRRPLPGLLHGELFVDLHVLNILNTTRVLNPTQELIIRTAFTDPSLQPFNPFTEAPVENVHWTFDDSGAAAGSGSTGLTLPRAVRLAFGVRF